MSRRCIGHIDGHSLWEDEGPGAARVMGHGGRMLLAGDLVTSTVTTTMRTPEQKAKRAEARAKQREASAR